MSQRRASSPGSTMPPIGPDLHPDARTSDPGTITYVGMGLSDPALLTLAGARVLALADVVAVTNTGLLDALREAHVALAPDARVLTLDPESPPPWRAGALLQAMGTARRVVRLCSGDPLTEAGLAPEVAACHRAGADARVLPAVAATTALTALAGLDVMPHSLRHITVADGPPVPSDVPPSGAAMVSLLAGAVPQLAQAALAAGRDGGESVLVMSAGRASAPLTWTFALRDLARWDDTDATPERRSWPTPGTRVLVGLGEFVPPAPSFERTTPQPLRGWQVLVPRTRESCGSLVWRLTHYGARPTTLDTLSLEPPRDPQPMNRAIRGLVDGRYRWVVFASSAATRLVLDTVATYGLDARAFSGVHLAAASPLAHRILAEHGLIPEVTSLQHARGGGALDDAFPEYDGQTDPMDRVLLPSVGHTAHAVAEGLRALGWRVDEVVVARTVRAAPPPVETRAAIKAGHFDAVMFTSPAAVRNLLGLAGKPSPRTVVAAIGEATAAECREHGLAVAVVADQPGYRGLADALASYALEHRRR
ncbi:MAG: uroporphyrinogen-III synthase [Actinomycetia bacterium]|nr:uroporphyrinogen-III synthase [Actinomycetes bacterium]